MAKSRGRARVAEVLVAATMLGGATAAHAHPGSSIAVDSQGLVYFVDTGRGVWRLDPRGGLTLIHTLAYHWMALDESGQFAKSNALGEFDRGSFQRITPAGFMPTT